jgi:hypothetical protein
MPVFLNTTDPNFEVQFQTLLRNLDQLRSKKQASVTPISLG